MRALIVDDEALARRGIRVRLERLGGVEVVGDCDSGRTAIAAIHALSPDVVFLDVQMPGLDGFEVVDQVGASNMPVTIFVTAYDSHAIRAFDAQALDYLLKPIDDDRFARAVSRARAHLSERGAAMRASKLTAIIDELHAGPRIVVRDRGSVNVIELGDVDWIAAEGDYVRIFAGSRSHLQRATMDAVEAQLDSERFVRVHRSAIVNVDRVREVRPRGDRDHIVVLRGGARVRVSRAGHDRLAALIARK